MDTSTATRIPDVEAATQALAGSVLKSAPFVRYAEARAALEGDALARQLLQSFLAAQTDVRQRQAHNLVTQEAIDQLRSLQGQVKANAVIMGYVAAQQAAIAYLREVNQGISQWLGVDFASLARRSSCCS